jgi:hypothetical protein
VSITRPSERENDAVRQPAGPHPLRRLVRGVLADLLLLVGLVADLVRLLGLRRAPLHQPHGGQDVEEELQVLRLPVLRDVDGEVRGGEEAPERDGPAAVEHLVVVVVRVAGDGLPEERGEEQQSERDAQPVVPEETLQAHHPVAADIAADLTSAAGRRR